METVAAPRPPAALWRRLVWFASIWAGGVLSLGVIAGILRAWLKAG